MKSGCKDKGKHKTANSFKNAVIKCWVGWRSRDSRLFSQDLMMGFKPVSHSQEAELTKKWFGSLFRAGLGNAHTTLSLASPIYIGLYGINRNIPVWSRFGKSYLKFTSILFCFTYEKNMKGLEPNIRKYVHYHQLACGLAQIMSDYNKA